jgi:hypothetical protein
VLDDSVDVPAGNERRGWFDHAPRLTDKLTQAARRQFPVDLLQE